MFAYPLLSQKYITYSECVSTDLVTQHEMHMCHIMLSSVACLDLKKNTELKICVLIFSTTFV